METKILVTLGPASLSREVVTACTDFGVNLFRLNLSHTPLDTLISTIRKIQSWTDVPVCLDSEGAQLRNQEMDGGAIEFEPGQVVRILSRTLLGNHERFSLTPASMVSHFKPGDRLRIDFNGAEFEIQESFEDHCTAVTIHGGKVGSNKAADINRELPFDPLTKKDLAAIQVGRENGIKNFALSFANCADDVQTMRTECGPDARIICKIESRAGVRNLDAILHQADEILIDRGDLSRQVDIQKIPLFQRLIIQRANEAGIPVHVATNLLETMTENGAPTRAEVNDVVSSLLMGADGLVLAAETAIGRYPVRAVEMIRLLINQVEVWNSKVSLQDLLDSD